MTRTKLAALVAAACLLVCGLTVANAAQLGVSSGSVSTATAGPCTTATIAATRTDPVVGGLFGYESVTLAVPEPCQGADRVAEVSVHRTNTAGTRISSGTRTGLTATSEVPVNTAYGGIFGSAYTLTITIDGWRIPATF